MQVRALRGATTVEEDRKELIISATVELLREMMERNSIKTEDIISVILTATEDLNSEFPAAAGRQIGFKYVPLLCSREINVPNDINKKCIRVLMHFYTEKKPEDLRHVYLGKARQLRTDLPE